MLPPPGIAVYEKTHIETVFYRNDPPKKRNLLVRIKEFEQHLLIKLRDLEDFLFNYTASVDTILFEQIKQEQSLDINYSEFKGQLVELLQQTLCGEMSLRIEADDSKCRLIFYEKSRIKSLIFLCLNLQSTLQREIIAEMELNIQVLREEKQNVLAQVLELQKHINEAESSTMAMKSANVALENNFKKELSIMDRILTSKIYGFTTVVSDRLMALTSRLPRLLADLELIKIDNRLRTETNRQLTESMQHMRNECESHFSKLRELQNEMEEVNRMRLRAEKEAYDHKLELGKREERMEEMEKKIAELKTDVTGATMIIAQKTVHQKEIEKEFGRTKQRLNELKEDYDEIFKQNDRLQDELKKQTEALKRTQQDFNKYRNKFNNEEFSKLKEENSKATQKIQELETQNREQAKLNAVLTKKLSELGFGSDNKTR